MNQPQILVLGSGAIGSYFGGRLAKAGLDVSIQCRSDYPALSKKPIIQIKSYQGDFSFEPKHILRSGDPLPTTYDYVLVCQKSLAHIPLVELIKPLADQGAAIVLIQNGVELEPPLANAYPQAEIIGGIAFIGVSRKQPGLIEHQIAGGLTLGSYPKGTSKKTQELADWFEKGGVDCRTTTKIQKERWRKLVWNIGFNPIGVLTQGADTHRILKLDATKRLVQLAMDEVIALANELGHEIDPAFAEKQIALTEKMNPYKTSMLLDFKAGRPMELEAIVGNALRKADEIGFAAPVLTTLYGLLVQYQS